jgi:hypothetical protein
MQHFPADGGEHDIFVEVPDAEHQARVFLNYTVDDRLSALWTLLLTTGFAPWRSARENSPASRLPRRVAFGTQGR